MKKKEYNWWDDPNNHEEVQRISWWNHPDKKEFIQFPIAVVSDDPNVWVASTNDETQKFLGDLKGCAQGKTKEEAISRMFKLIIASHEYSEECRLNYQRWVPFRKGDWRHIGGRWIEIFGFHISFRWGRNNKYGWFVPFTPLNISFYSQWVIYKNWKLKRNQNNEP